MNDNVIIQVKYKADNYKYQLEEDYKIKISVIPPTNIVSRFFSLNEDGLLSIKAGYAWDGATGIPDSKTVIRGSLIHDVLYQMIREGHLDSEYRKIADEVLYHFCLLDGTNKPWAWMIYRGVRLLGGPFTKIKKDRQVKTAP